MSRPETPRQSCGHRRPEGADLAGLCPSCLLELGLDATREPQSPWLDPHVRSCRVFGLLGADGATTSYLAEQSTSTPRVVALTALGAALASDDERARATAALCRVVAFAHAHVARVFGAFLSDAGVPVLVGEHVPGTPVDRYCSQHGLERGQRATLLLPAVEGLEAAHGQGLAHGRLTPSSLVVTVRNQAAAAVVIGLGRADVAGEPAAPSADVAALASIAGSLGVAVPEAARRSAGALGGWLRELTLPTMSRSPR